MGFMPVGKPCMGGHRTDLPARQERETAAVVCRKSIHKKSRASLYKWTSTCKMAGIQGRGALSSTVASIASRSEQGFSWAAGNVSFSLCSAGEKSSGAQ